MNGYDRLPWAWQSVARGAPRRSLLRVAENQGLNSQNVYFVGYILSTTELFSHVTNQLSGLRYITSKPFLTHERHRIYVHHRY